MHALTTVALAFAVGGQASAAPTLRQALKTDLQQYLSARGAIEHISAASLSINTAPNAPIIDVTAGTTTYGGTVPVTPDMLFQIGSNTKAFTAVALLQLEAVGVLSVSDPVGKWLPQYPAYKNVTIAQLLNMTSGIPTYDDTSAMLTAYASNPYRYWSAAELVRFVYPKTSFAPGTKWQYSNTAYIMSQEIIEKATHRDYAYELDRRFFDGGPAVHDMYYYSGTVPSSIQRRMVAGYFFNHAPDNRPLAPLLARDVRPFSMSWAQGAGAIIATPHAMVHWVRALYESPMLAAAQRRQMESVVSLATGQPVTRATAKDPRTFGLGVAELHAPNIGTVWFYEGETLGYRMVHIYDPKTKLVITLGLNSQPDGDKDNVGKLISSIYAIVERYANSNGKLGSADSVRGSARTAARWR
jgi:D-alanyl-D-alanine carboxypeptidase